MSITKNKEECRECYEKEIKTYETKEFKLICSECFSADCLLNVCINSTVSAECELCSGFEDKEINGPDILDDILRTTRPYLPYSIKTKCPNCGGTTTHICIDSQISDIIILLNKFGYKTDYSCEGHIDGSGAHPAYIAFKDDITEYFDRNNHLLKYWDIEPPYIIRVSSDAPFSYIINKEYLYDLRKYIETSLIKKEKDNDELSDEGEFIKREKDCYYKVIVFGETGESLNIEGSFEIFDDAVSKAHEYSYDFRIVKCRWVDEETLKHEVVGVYDHTITGEESIYFYK